MNNARVITCFCIAIGVLIVSCSSTSQMSTAAKDGPSEKSVFPSWYNTSRSMEIEDDSFHAYATALDSDSVASGEKAGTQAKAVLESEVSRRLESIRNDAAVELGSDSGVDSPQFIIALRNAEDEISSTAVITETDVQVNENESFRGFAKASVDKEELIQELDKALSAHGNAWNAIKASQAFSKF